MHLAQGQGHGQGVQVLVIPLVQAGKRGREVRGGGLASGEPRDKIGGLQPRHALRLHLSRKLCRDEKAQALIEQGPGPGKAVLNAGSACRCARTGRVRQGQPGVGVGVALGHLAQGLRLRGQAQVHGHAGALGEKPPEIGQKSGGLALGVTISVGGGVVRADDHQRRALLGQRADRRAEPGQGQQKRKDH